MNLLFIAEKPSMKQLIEREFTKHSEALCYTVDVVCASAFVIADEDAERYLYNTEGFEQFSMESRTVPKNYKIRRDYLPQCRGESISKIERGNFYYIVNACDPDEAGELMFDYTRENFGLLDYPTLKFNMITLLSKHSLEAFKEIESQLAALN